MLFLISRNPHCVGLRLTGWALSRTDGCSEGFQQIQLQDFKTTWPFGCLAVAYPPWQ